MARCVPLPNPSLTHGVSVGMSSEAQRCGAAGLTEAFVVSCAVGGVSGSNPFSAFLLEKEIKLLFGFFFHLENTT